MKITDIVDKLIPNNDLKEPHNPPTPYLKRGSRGRFVSKKKPLVVVEAPQVVTPSESVEKANSTPHETITLSFYGSPITKYRVGNKWYFSVSDVLGTGKPFDNEDEIHYSEQFDEVKKKNCIMVNDIEVAEGECMLLIIHEVKALFPGPLSRWLLG